MLKIERVGTHLGNFLGESKREEICTLTGVSSSLLSKIISGKRVTARVAVKLALLGWRTAEELLAMQAEYDLYELERENQHKIK